MSNLWGQRLENAARLLDEGQSENCLSTCHQMVEDNTTPRDIQMKTWILMALATNNWHEVEKLRNIAEHCYDAAILSYAAAAQNEQSDEFFGALRRSLDRLKEAQQHEAPPGVDLYAPKSQVKSEGDDFVDYIDEELEASKEDMKGQALDEEDEWMFQILLEKSAHLKLTDEEEEFVAECEKKMSKFTKIPLPYSHILTERLESLKIGKLEESEDGDQKKGKN